MDTQPVKEKPTDEPVYLYIVNSNNPGQASSYPAIHLSKYEISSIVWCEVNGIPTGMVL